MIGIKKEIVELLSTNDCVIVPGIGGFIANYVPAFIHPQQHTFHPPSRQIAFNAKLKTNDGLLTHYISQKLGISYSQASEYIKKEVISAFSRLGIGDKIELEGIGLLFEDKEGHLQFLPEEHANLLDDAFGLPGFISAPINRNPLRKQNKRVHIITGNRQLRKTLIRAAIFLPFASLSLWALMNTDKVASMAGATASWWPSAYEYTALAPENSIRTAVVEVERFKPEPEVAKEIKPAESATPEVPAAGEDEVYFIIAGAFGVKNNADNLVGVLKEKGYEAKIIGVNPQGLHMVSIAGFSRKHEAINQLQILRQGEMNSAWLFTKK